MNQVLRFMLVLVSSLMALTFAHAVPPGQLFLPVSAAEVASGAISLQVPGIYSRQINPAVMQLKPDEEVELVLPNGKNYLVAFDRTEKHPNGDETWIGHVKSDFGTDYRVIITTGKASIVGKMLTPAGDFLLKTENGQLWLVDPVAAGIKETLTGGSQAVVPEKTGPQSQKATMTVPVAAATSAPSTIDLAVLYSPSMVTKLGSVAAVEARINQLVAVSNQVYIDSGIALTLRLVHTEQINFPDSKTLNEANYAIIVSENPSYAALHTDPSMAGVKAMRDLYGADLVTYVRPFDPTVEDTCYWTWTGGLGLNASIMSTYSVKGYSVINDGADIRGSGKYCTDYTLVRALGMNMGSYKELAAANGQSGAYPYSFEYGVSGVFGTVLSSYSSSLRLGKFSSPLLSCNGYPCGIADQADNVRSINNLRGIVANYRPTGGTNPTSLSAQSGWWWNANEGGRGYFIEVKNGRYFTASYLYDNSGNPIWYVSGPDNVSGSTLPGFLGAYSGGQTLTGTYKAPAGPSPVGSMSISFSDSTHGTITWPGGTVPITRYELGTGSLALPDPSFKPETGWWWNASEGGRGFSIEVQGDNLFIAGFMYDGGGNPVWYVSAGKMTTPTLYQGTWAQYQNGQAMGGPARTASVKNANVGGVSISFSSTTTATLLLPDGRTLPLTRYPF